MLFETPEVREAEAKVLSDINSLRDQLKWRLREPRRWYGSLRKMSFSRAIQGSNSIEGYSASLDDAAAVVVDEEPLDSDDVTVRALSGYRDAMTFVLQQAEDPDFRFSGQLLKSLHFMMTSYGLENRPGRWRSGTALIRNDQSGEIVFEGPDRDDVPTLVNELVEDLNQDDNHHALVRAGMAHLNLVMIHPFKDGNGRMARCLQSLVLAREGFLDTVFMSIEEYLGRNTPAYYKVLGEVGGGSWQPERDSRPWLRFILTAHLRQAKTMLRRTKESELLWTKLEEFVELESLPERTMVALFDAAMSFRVRNATYRALFENSEDEITESTASRDLKRLVDAGFLVARGERRGRHYTATERLTKVWKAILDARDPEDFADPFESAS